MKKIFVMVLVLAFVVSTAFAGEYSPLTDNYVEANGVGDELQTVTQVDTYAYRIFGYLAEADTPIFVVSAPNSWNATAANYLTKCAITVNVDNGFFDVDLKDVISYSYTKRVEAPMKILVGITIDANGNTLKATIKTKKK